MTNAPSYSANSQLPVNFLHVCTFYYTRRLLRFLLYTSLEQQQSSCARGESLLRDGLGVARCIRRKGVVASQRRPCTLRHIAVQLLVLRRRSRLVLLATVRLGVVPLGLSLVAIGRAVGTRLLLLLLLRGLVSVAVGLLAAGVVRLRVNITESIVDCGTRQYTQLRC